MNISIEADMTAIEEAMDSLIRNLAYYKIGTWPLSLVMQDFRDIAEDIRNEIKAAESKG